MASTEKIFTLSYDELLEHTKKVVTDFRNLSTGSSQKTENKAR